MLVAQENPAKPTYQQLVLKRRKLTAPRQWPGRTNEGWDTETVNGKAFLMANSQEWRSVEDLDDCLSFLTQHRFRQVRNTWWNLRYDVTAIFKHEPNVMMDLELNGEAEWHGYKFSYLRGKFLRITTPSRQSYYHYDIAQFYFQALANAARRYLNRTPPEIKEHRHELHLYDRETVGDYCRWDATATRDLTDLYTTRLERVNLYPKHLISGGNVAQSLLLSAANVPTWQDIPQAANRLGWAAQRGAWIDLWQRGEAMAWKADIKSAYPAHMRDMPDMRDGQWVYEPNPSDAAYGFCRAKVYYGEDTLPILAAHVAGTNIYPHSDSGIETVLTIDEYRYLKRTGSRIEADLWTSFVPDENPRYPWRGLIDKLNVLKEEESSHKGTDKFDPGFYLALKGLINSQYGKTCEKVPIDGTSDWRAGRLYNPVASSHTLARTRIQVAEAIGSQKRDVIAIATDSVSATKPLKNVEQGTQLGDWDIETPDEGERAIFFQPGVYQYESEDPHTRGFKKSAIGTLWDIANTHAPQFTITTERPYSGRQASRWGKPDLANIFDRHDYTIKTPNTRRIWAHDVTHFGELLDQLIPSSPVPTTLLEEIQC